MTCNRFIRALSWLAVLAAGCQDSFSVATGAVEGRVVDPAGEPRAGAQVTAFLVGPAGDLALVSRGPAAITDEQGRYLARVDLGAADGAELMLRAELAGDKVGTAVVLGRFESDGALVAPPIGPASTALGDLYLRARLAGQWRQELPPGAARIFVSDELAASLVPAADHEGGMTAAAQAAAAGTAGWLAMLRHPAVGAREVELQPALSAVARAEVELYADLHAAATPEQAASAFDLYRTTFTDAFLGAGLGSRDLALAGIAAAQAALTYRGALPPAGQAQLIARAEALRADVVTSSIEAEVQDIDPSATAAVAHAGFVLRADLAAAAAMGEQADTQARMAWSTYSGAVQEALFDALDLSAISYAHATAAAMIALGELLTAWAPLSEGPDATTAVDTVVIGLADFHAAMLRPGNRSILTGAGLSPAAAEATLHVLALLYASPA